MRHASVTKRFTFEAAHALPYHQGKCQRLHGHSYKLEVSVYGPVNDVLYEPKPSDYGMVYDFSDLSALVKDEIVNVLDHQNLNDVTGIYTTCENLCWWIFRRLSAALDAKTNAVWPQVQSVRLWETETGWCEVNTNMPGKHDA